MIKEDDLMMISDSDVFITTDLDLKPLDNLSYKAWVYWVSNNNNHENYTGDNDAEDLYELPIDNVYRFWLIIGRAWFV